MIKITLGDTQLPHIEYEVNGTKRSWDIDHNTLFEFLQRNCYKEVKRDVKKPEVPVFESPALPKGTVKYMALPDGQVVLFMEQKEGRFDITYHNKPYKKVPFPNLLFVFTFAPTNNGYRITNKKCFAFKDKVFRDTTKLYRFPFSHVQGDGEMCFFFMSELQDLAQMTSFVHNWMAADITDHYYNLKDVNKWGLPLRQIFEETQGKPRFDYTKLHEPKRRCAKDIVASYVNRFFN
ncbi:hypothetical protein ACFX4N_24110 [Priestia sp. YIM B13551]|uniref:hypothetical protein n=1 Tax=Priestia sp. YIM B13551 TaxID=3366306 RepID=UPI003670E3AB